MKRPTIPQIEAYFSGLKLPRKKKKNVLAYQRKHKNGYVPDVAFQMMQRELAEIEA